MDLTKYIKNFSLKKNRLIFNTFLSFIEGNLISGKNKFSLKYIFIVASELIFEIYLLFILLLIYLLSFKKFFLKLLSLSLILLLFMHNSSYKFPWEGLSNISSSSKLKKVSSFLFSKTF